MGNKTIKPVVFWVVVGFAALLLWQVTKANSVQPAIPEISYSQFMSDIDAGDVARVTISGNQVRAQYRAEGGTFRVTAPHSQAAMLASLQSKKAEIWIRESEGGTSPVTQLLGTWAPLLLLGGLWFFMIRQMWANFEDPAAGGKLRHRRRTALDTLIALPGTQGFPVT